MNILLVVSRFDNLAAVIRKIKSNTRDTVYYIAPISYGAEGLIREIESSLKSSPHTSCQVIDFQKHLHHSFLQAKRKYFDFIDDFSNQEILKGENLKEFFHDSSKAFSFWWLSLVYEKSPGKTDVFLLFSKICCILNLKEELGCDEIWLSNDKRHSPIAQALLSVEALRLEIIGPRREILRGLKNSLCLLREWLRALKYLLESLKKSYDIQKVKIHENLKKESLQRHHLFLISYLSQINKEALACGRYESTAYSCLQTAIEEKLGPAFAWLTMYASVEQYTWKDVLNFSQKIDEYNKRVFRIEGWLQGKNVWKIMREFLRVCHRCILSLSKVQKFKFNIGNGISINLWSILREDYLSSFGGKVLMNNLVFLNIFDNLVNDLPDDAVIIHFAEMHAWERCLKVACSKKPNIQIVGIQHTIVPLLLLNYFNTPASFGRNFVHDPPILDLLGCVGEVTKNLFLESGWPPEKLFVLGGFRFQGLAAQLPALKDEKSKNRLVVTGSICANENEEILFLLHQAFRNTEDNVEVVLKSHPCLSMQRACRSLKLDLNKRIFKFVDEPLEKVLPGALALMAGGTSSVFYALQYDVPIILPYLFNAIDLSPLTGLYDGFYRVKDAYELKNLIGAIANKGGGLLLKKESPGQFNSRYFFIPEDRGKYFDNLNTALNRKNIVCAS